MERSAPSHARIVDQEVYLRLLLLDSISQLVTSRFGLVSQNVLSMFILTRR